MHRRSLLRENEMAKSENWVVASAVLPNAGVEGLLPLPGPGSSPARSSVNSASMEEEAR